MGTTDAAQLNGSEQIYMPRQGVLSRWNPGATIIAYDPTQADVVSLNPDLSNAAALMVYGHGFDDPARGFVMYEAGHSHNKGTAGDVAAQRAFLNFSFFQITPKAPQLNITGVSAGQLITGNTTINPITVVATSPLTGISFTYQWSSSCGGSFSNPTGTTTNYIAPTVGATTSCVITCKVTDNCGRVSFQSFPVTILPPPAPPVANPDIKTLANGCLLSTTTVTIDVLANDTDPLGLALTFDSIFLASASPANAGTWSSTAAGIVSFTPAANFVGAASIPYRMHNSQGTTATSTVTINIGTVDSKGCFPNQVWGIANGDFITTDSVINNVGALGATPLTTSSLDDQEGTFTTVGTDFVDMGTALANLIDLHLTATLNIGDTVQIDWGKKINAGTTAISLKQSATATFSGVATSQTITGSGNIPTATRYPILANGTNYIRIQVGTGTTQNLYIDAVELEQWSCVSRAPVSGGDNFVVAEDNPTNLDVLANDIDPATNDNSTLTVSGIVSQPAKGKVSINPDNTITYVSIGAFGSNTTDAFTYTVCNTQGYCSTATVTLNIQDDGCSPDLTNYRPNPLGAPSTLTVNPTNDSHIEQNHNNNAYGAVNIVVGNKPTSVKRGLLTFDLSSIPAGSIVTNAILTTQTSANSGYTATINVHKVTTAWAEATVKWKATAPWTTAGGDFTSTIQASASVPTGTNIVATWNIAGLAQDWVNTPAGNLGLLLKTTEGVGKQHTFYSKEFGTASFRPKLVVTYQTPLACQAIPNRAPLAMPDTATTNSVTMVSIPVISNDGDPENNPLTLASIKSVTNGTAVISGNNIQFTPTVGFNGKAKVYYRVSDGTSLDSAYAYITVTNAPPVAVNDLPASALSGLSQTVNVGTNDSDPESASPLTWSIYRQGKNGSSTIAGSSITYTPNAGFTGKDTVYYQLAEPVAGCSDGAKSIAYVVFTVANRQPTLVNNNKTILPCLSNIITLVTNGTDPENGFLTVTNLSALSNPAAGILINNNDGTVTFSPATGFTGSVTFTYTVTDDGVTPLSSTPATFTINVVSPVNTAPLAVNDVSDATLMDQVVYYSVLDNDSDPQNDPLSLPVITVAPLHGTATVLANGLVKYTPNPGFFGTDILTYRICDSVITPATCAKAQGLCSTATVSFSVYVPNTVVAVNDENSTWINTPVSGAVMANDFDPQGDTKLFTGFISGGSAVTSGSITVSGVDASGGPVANAGTLTINANGTYTFTPANNFTGIVTVPYTITDNNINPAIDTAYLKITVSPFTAISNSVIANNDENISYGAPVSANVLVNDRDPQGNAFSVTGFNFDSNGDGTADAAGTPGTPVIIGGITTTGLPTGNAGTLILNTNGTYTFTPAADFHGSVDVPYTICDNGVPVACATALLHIDVLPDINGSLNDPPQAGDDFAYTNVNTPVTSTFIANDSDPNNDPVSLNGITINTGGPATPIGATVTTAHGGTVQFYANGTYTYTPPTGYVGPDSVGYEICDVTAVAPQPLCTKAFLHLLVGVNNTTDAINDENSTWQGIPVPGNVLTNDFDAEYNVQTFGSFLAQNQSSDISSGTTIAGVDKNGNPVANAGTITFAANGNYTFNPDPAFTGTVTVPYRLCDNGNLPKCDTAFLTITVDPLPTTGINSVIANNDENISYGLTVGGSLFVNDRDPQNDAFTVTSFVGGTVGTPGIVAGIDLNGNPVANAGTLTINANGTYTFTPAPGFVGSVDVPYTITDALGATATAKLHIDVLKDPNGTLNDPPVAGDDFGYTTINKPVTGSFISNDNDPNGDPLSYMGVTIVPAGPATAIGGPVATAQGGTVQFYANGTYLYTPPAGYVGPDRLPYTICDVTVVAPQPLCADATIHLLVGPGINITGRVWDDANGNISINGGENGTNAANALYVNLVDGSGHVVAATAVAADGTYSFSNINPGANYSLVLSTTQGTIGQPAPSAALPAGWANTGENRNGVIDGGSVGIIDTRNFGYTNTINFDFGIEQLPNTDNHSTNITQPNPGQYIVLNGGANPPVLSGIDPEDCNAGCVLSSKSVIIDAVPANAELYYNGVLVTNGQQINNFNPNLLQIKMTNATLGSTSTSFQYSYVDAAGKKDPTPATYTLTWLNPLPVILSSFTGLANKCDAVLQWKTAQEINTDKFVIEQSSNGLNFTAVAEVKSANSSTGKSYQVSIAQTPGIMYYRLKLLDKDGRFSYSPIITVRSTCSGIDYVTVYPNPVNTHLTVSFYTGFRGYANLVIVNAVGQQLEVKKLQVTTSVNTINLDMSNYVPGMYILYLADDSGVKIGEVQKLIKN